jgi:tetratricopeptide (TPR) repeat protein
VKFGFAVTNENAAAIAEICHQLDGLPLAIELAAARVRVLPPQRMLAEFSHRPSFLTRGGRDLPERQKTLRNTIDWSHALLTVDEQQLFRRLAVFVGGCNLEAIESVCNMENKLCVLETMESLVGKSLVTQTEAHGIPRFAMLETIREYARDNLIAADDEERVRTRHRDYFLALAEEAKPNLIAAKQAAWLERLEANHENLRAALDWSVVNTDSTAGLRLCGALQRFWWTRGHIAEGREWCQRVLDMPGAGALSAERANVLNGAGRLALYHDDLPSAQALSDKSLAIMREQGDRRGIAASLHNLATVARRKGDYPTATMLYEEGLMIYRELGDQHGRAVSLSNLGAVALDLGDHPTANARHEECLAIMRNLGDASGIATSLGNLGLLSYEQGDYPRARARQEESLAIRRELGDRDRIALSLGNLGNVAFMQGEFATSLALIQECLATWHEMRNKGGVALCLAGLARVVDAVGKPLHAARIWGTAERLREEIGSQQPPVIRARYDLRVAASRAALGDEAAFDRAWLEGRAMTLEQAIALALNEKIEKR